MNGFSHPPGASRGGFTLVEMLTATAVLILMIALLAPMFSSLTSTTSNSGEKMEIDVTARQALDRIGRDFSLMALREDLDYSLQKLAGNDQFDFYSRVPGVLPGGVDPAADPASGLTLVSYRVVDGNLERMSVAQSLDSLSFLTYDTAGDLVTGTGITGAMAAASPADYHVLCEGVFRFELGFLLKDGTFARLPMNEALNAGITNADPGYREWSPSPHAFARVRVPDGPSKTVFRALGWQDVAAIVVTLAVMDPANATRTTPSGLDSAAGNLSDAVDSTNPTAVVLPGTVWKSTLETAGALGLPQDAQNAVRIYQRTYFLNTP